MREGEEQPGRRKSEKPQRRFVDVVKGGVQGVGMTEEDVKDRVRCSQYNEKKTVL